MPFSRCMHACHILRLACFLAVLAAPGWHNSVLVLQKTLILKNWPIYGRYGHIHRYRGQIHTCSPGRLQGHLWVILTIGSCFYGSFWLFSVLGSGLLPHTRSKTLKTTVFLTQNTTFWPMKGQKIKKIDICKSPQFFVPWCEGLPNGMSLFRMRPFWSPKAYLGHMGQNHHISTWRRKNQPIFQNKGFPWNLSRSGCRWSP